jgi:hypothetical protein
MELKQILDSSKEFTTLNEVATRLAAKWEKTGLLEGLSDKSSKNSMSMILENQTKQIVAEQSQTGTGGIGSGGNQEAWAGIALPLVRKVFAQIAAKEFVSVQPMNLPSGLVFYLDFKYGTNTGAFNSGDSVYGTLDVLDQDASGGLYGSGRFAYSSNSSSLALTAQVTGSATSASIEYQDGTNPGDYIKVEANMSSTAFDTKGVRAFRLLSGSTDITSNPELTSVTGNTVSFVVSTIAGAYTASAAGDFNGSVVYHQQPTDVTRGDFEDTSGTLKIPEINVELSSLPIVAKTKKLKAQWTPEFSQDLNKYQSVDAEAELTSFLSEHVSMEVDLEILSMLLTDARTTERWSAENNKVWKNGAWTTSTSDFYNTQGGWFQTLGTKVQKVSNKIHQKTLRGGANFLVCSPSVATILESIPGYAASTDGDKMEFAMGVQKVGSLNSRYKVYKNPYMTENVILLGYRGSQFLETGAVYAPYVPLIMTPLIYDPETFTPRKGLMTRYAKKMIRPEFYGKVFISDVDTV